MNQIITIFKIPELRKKIFITLIFLAVYRIGFFIPLPMIDQVKLAEREALAPLERDAGADVGPFRLQYELQNLMQDKAGIAREEGELTEALDGIEKLKARAEVMGAGGSREYNPGWHTALDLHNLLTVSEAVALAARERKESRGAHARVDYQAKDPAWGTFNFVLRKAKDGSMEIRREPISPIRQDLQDIIKEQG